MKNNPNKVEEAIKDFLEDSHDICDGSPYDGCWAQDDVLTKMLIKTLTNLEAEVKYEVNNSWINQPANEHDERIRKEERKKFKCSQCGNTPDEHNYRHPYTLPTLPKQPNN